MGVLAGSWLSIALIQLTSPPGSTSDALGVFLLVAGLAMTIYLNDGTYLHEGTCRLVKEPM
jgi:hypothetical protein